MCMCVCVCVHVCVRVCACVCLCVCDVVAGWLTGVNVAKKGSPCSPPHDAGQERERVTELEMKQVSLIVESCVR